MEQYSEVLRTLLENRGIKTKKEAEIFLNPDYERDLHDPFLMRDMTLAVKRVKKAIDENEKIVVFSDYDCDGITGAVIFTDLFKRLGFENYGIYIPDRNSEGYGLNAEAIEEFREKEVNLLITVDLGIRGVKEVAIANKAGIEVIVTDHHALPEELPPALAILHPQVGEYPTSDTCGAGVAFKFAQAFLKTHGEEYGIKEGMSKWMLDMAGLATVADMVPLSGENRAITSFGLKVLRKSPRVGLHKLLAKLRINQRFITEDDLSFMVIPRLNAASRMDSPMLAYDFLATDDEVQGDILAAHLTKINNERKTMVASIMKEAKKTLVKRETREVIVIGNPTWRPGVLGIVASKLVEEYARPAFVWGKDTNETIKGSCRGDGSVSMVSLMKSTADYFVEFGGHTDAGGFTIHTEKVHFLEEALSMAWQSSEQILKESETAYDMKAGLDLVNMKIWQDLQKLAPFGMGNPKPSFLFEGVKIEKVRTFGKNGGSDHLELLFTDSSGKKVKGISFFTKTDSFRKKVAEGARVNLLASLDMSRFMGRKELQLRIIDIY